MPITYYIVTTNYVSNLVNDNNFNKLDDYLINGSTKNQDIYHNINNAIVAPWVNIKDSYKEKLYHILSYATDIANLNVLNYYKDKIDVNYYPDGNSYNLIHLSIENYIENYHIEDESGNKDRFDTIILLLESQIQNNINFTISLQGLTEFCNKYNNYELVLLLLTKFNADIDFLYSSSIVNNYPKVFDWIIENFYDKISVELTKKSIEAAFNDNNDEIIKYVLNKIKTVNNEDYDKLKYLDDPTKFIIKSVDNLIIPEKVTYIKTSNYFDSSICNVKLPKNLKEIHFGESFNKPLSNITFPDSVEEITFGKKNNFSSFNQLLKNIKFPKSLKVFWNNGFRKDKNIKDIKFPDSVEKLKPGKYYKDNSDKGTYYDVESYYDEDDGTFNCKDSSNDGHIECLKKLHESGYHLEGNICFSAAKRGHLECLKYAHKNGCYWNKSICEISAKNGHLDCLKYAYENGCKMSKQTCYEAARAGQIECLKYAYENGCKIDKDALSVASTNLECLKYLKNIGLSWNPNTAEIAAVGKLECLQYVHENGYPWSEQTCSSAAMSGEIECLKYAYENGSPINKEEICEDALFELNGRNLECLKYLHENGCKLHNHYCIIAKNSGNIEILNYLLENGCELNMEEYKRCRR